LGKLQDEIKKQSWKMKSWDDMVWGCVLEKKDVSAIIEKMKSEFPKFNFVEIVDSNEKFMGVPLAVMVDLNKIREILEWYKEWLE